MITVSQFIIVLYWAILLESSTSLVNGQNQAVPIEVPLDRDIRLSCQPKMICDQSAIERYQWIRGGALIGSGKEHLIPQITLQDAGVYLCRIFYRSNGRILQQDVSHVIRVKEQPKEPEFSLSVYQEPSKEIIGEQVIFEAKVTPTLSNVTFTWVFQGNIVSRSNVHIIEIFRTTNRGVYSCQAQGYNQETKSNVSLQAAIVTAGYNEASFYMLPDTGITISTKEKNGLRLICHKSGIDQNTKPEWTFSRKELGAKELSSMKMNLSNDAYSSNLLFQSVENRHEGLYECKVGSKRLSALVKISRGGNGSTNGKFPTLPKEPNSPSSSGQSGDANVGSVSQLDTTLNRRLSDQNNYIRDIRDSLREFVSLFKKAPFMKAKPSE